LTVLGGGVPSEAVHAAFSVEARAHITVIDRLPEEDVIAAYRSHDLLVLPSSYEGFGMVVLEAMSQRLPVVATPVGCAALLIENETTGLIVPTRDSEALSAALDRLLADPALRARLAEAARARVCGMTWTRTAHATLESYARAIAPSGPPLDSRSGRPEPRQRAQ